MFGILAAEAITGIGASIGAAIAAIGAGIGIGKIEIGRASCRERV